MSRTGSVHYGLCVEGAKWVMGWRGFGCKYVAVELVCAGAENPDVWGTNGFESVMVEVKTSRGDFLKDRRKFTRRKEGEMFAVGNYRFYLVPKGLVVPEELPERWGLLEWDGGRIVLVKGAERMACENRCELAILCSSMRR